MIHKLLKPFCADRKHHVYCCEASFVQSGHCYATDTRIIVRVPTADPDSVPEDGRRYPPASDICKYEGCRHGEVGNLVKVTFGLATFDRKYLRLIKKLAKKVGGETFAVVDATGQRLAWEVRGSGGVLAEGLLMSMRTEGGY